MIDILFSHTYYYPLDKKQWNNKTPFPPLGTIYAAALLRKHDFTVDLFDTNLLDDCTSFKPVILNKQPKYLVLYDDGFNYLTKMCLTTMREAAFKMIALAKANNITVVVCSSDSTDHFEKYLSAGADYVIKGEGELALLELIKALEDNQSVEHIESLVFKDNDVVKSNAPRKVLKQLDELPLPAWDLVDIESYKAIWAQGHNEFTLNIATTRGCPYKCNWCAKPIYGNRYNSHSPEYIVNQITFLQEKFGVKKFWMCDDIFGLKPKWVQKFNTILSERKVVLSYYIQSRADLLLKADTIDALSESGLEEVWIGAESGSQKILDAMDKGTQVSQIEKATQLLKAKGIKIAFFIQFGYLGETKADIRKTINLIKRLVPDNLGVSVSYPLPGTKFYEIVKQDLQLKSNWTDSDDLAMMFKGSFNSKFYKKLHRYVHKEWKKSKAIDVLKGILRGQKKLTFEGLKLLLAFAYYAPSAFMDKLILKQLDNTNA